MWVFGYHPDCACLSVLLCSAPRVSKSPRGLPWWCVLVGWLLVAATSGVAAFFTMLYGLHYGKASSLRWLISTAVSFVESVFITQPLKVRTPPPPSKWRPMSFLPLPSWDRFLLKHSYYFYLTNTRDRCKDSGDSRIAQRTCAEELSTS